MCSIFPARDRGWLTTLALVAVGVLFSPAAEWAWAQDPPALAEPATAQPEPASAEPAINEPAAAEPAKAETPSETPLPAAPTPAEGASTAPHSYGELRDPAMAERLGLSEDQRQQVEQLLASRQRALDEVAAEERPQLELDYEQLLRSVLNPRQQRLWNELTSNKAVSDELRFNFRFQPWADVLNWFAERADLSLVLDAPPPGTFNYIDQRAYSTSEALDLLNGVLMTKGYTLVRRERMLLLLPLVQGLPADLVPQVPLEQIDQRGRYEFVSVLFNLGKRPPQEVNDEIKPLLGPFGKSAPLPKTRQLLVTETAGKMQAIQAVIESIPEPREAPAAAQGPTPEKPVLATYDIGTLAPAATLDVLKAILPDAKLVHDPKTNRLAAFAVASQQAAVKSMLEQMQADAPEGQAARLESHSTVGIDTSQLLTLVRPLLTQAQLLVDTVQPRLLAWGTPADHKLIDDAIAGMRGGARGDSVARVAIYPLRSGDPTSLATLLAGLVPTAKLVADARTRSLLVYGDETVHRAVEETVSRIESEAGPAAKLEFEVYDVAPGQSATALSLLKTTAPQAQVTYDEPTRRLLVLARAVEQQQVAELLARLSQSVAGVEAPELKIYNVPEERRKQIVSVLESLATELPGIRKVIDAETGEMAIWARPDQHATIAKMLDSLTAQSPPADGRTTVVYPLKMADPTAVSTVLTALAPRAKVVVEPKSKQVIVTASPDEQQRIGALVEQMDRPPEPGQQLQLVPHALLKADPTSVLTILRTLRPELQLVSDAKGTTLYAWARGEDHELVRETIARMQPEVPESLRPRLEIYPAGRANAATAAAVLAPLVPTARITADTQAGHVAAWATAEEHEQIARALAQMQESDGASQRHLVVYPVRRDRLTTVISLLPSVVPQAVSRADEKQAQVLVFARNDEHQLVRETLDSLEASAPEKPRTLAVFPLEGRDPTAALGVLQSTFDQVKFTSDTRSGSLLAWGSEDDHARIREVLDQWAEQAPAGKAAPRAYRPKNIDALTAYTVVRSLLPSVVMTLDTRSNSIVATASPSEHEQISQAIAELEAGGSAGQKLVVYPLGGREPSSVASLLQSGFTDARVVADTRSGSLMVWAKPEQQEQIAENVRQLTEQSPESRQTTEVYRFARADATAAFAVLRQLLPSVPMAPDTRANTLLVTASPGEHAQLRAAVAEMEAQGPVDNQQALAIYPLEGRDPSAMVALLQTSMPDARFVADTRGGNLLVWARAEQQALVRKNLEQAQQEAAAARPNAQVYHFKRADPSAAYQALRSMFPTAGMAVDTTARALIVTAAPAEQQQVRETVDELERQAESTGAPTLAVYETRAADPGSLLNLLRTMFATQPEVRVSIDPRTERIVVWAPAAQQTIIAETLKHLEGGASPDAPPQLEVYPLGSADAQAVFQVVSALLARIADTRVVQDAKTGQLAVLARPEQHATIRATIDQMQASAPQVEVFPLRRLDPFTAEFTLSKLFGDGRGDPLAPKIDSDPDASQLLVRGTQAQLDQIRRVLAKMGETELASQAGTPAGPSRRGTIRTLEMPPGVDDRALDELRELWERLRPNPLRVVTPSAVAPLLRETAPAAQPPNSPGAEGATESAPAPMPPAAPSDAPAAETQPTEPHPGGGGDDGGVVSPTPEAGAPSSAPRVRGLVPAKPAVRPIDDASGSATETLPRDQGPSAASNEPAAEGEVDVPSQATDAAPAGNLPGESPRRAAPQADQAPSPSADEVTPPEGETNKAAPPILIAPGDGSWTIASEDEEALDAFERLLKTLEPRRGSSGRQFTLFRLRHVDAVAMADTLQKIFEQRSFSFSGSGGVTIVPDRRLNALIVRASPNDLADVEQLLSVLDTAAQATSLVARQPQLIAVKNTRASDIFEVLRDVYRTQLSSAGPGRQVNLPSGLSREFASLVARLNQAASGPEMTIGVDVNTNSLVVLAEPELFREVEALIHSLDEAALDSQRTVRVLPLSKTNVEAVQKSLQWLMGGQGRRRGRSSSGSSQ